MLALLPSAASIADQPARPSDLFIRQLDELSALWSFYKRHSISNGRVISHDENGITTSEGQGYAMLRAVWSERPDDVYFGLELDEAAPAGTRRQAVRVEMEG
ncbi:MAG: hypothetical protein C4294_12680 [Nitrospiraceae bacterium]